LPTDEPEEELPPEKTNSSSDKTEEETILFSPF